MTVDKEPVETEPCATAEYVAAINELKAWMKIYRELRWICR